jgi:hypothetical protein
MRTIRGRDMRTERFETPETITRNAFAGPAAAVSVGATSAPPARRTPSPVWLAGVAAAVAGGVFLGFVAQPKDGGVSSAQAEAAATPLPVELAAATPQTAPAIGKLDVRPAVEPTAAVATAPTRLDLPRAAAPLRREDEDAPAAVEPAPVLEVAPPAAEASEESIEDEPTG